jgi:dTDP-4-amino-4,6-dideoxygalactose transaminase
MRDSFLIFGNPLIEQPEIDEVVDSLKTGWLGTGPKALKFEQMFAKYKGSQHALAVNSCTAAMHLSLLAVGIKPGDEVIVPTMTFASTANVVIHCGAKPVLVDCQIDTMNIDPNQIEQHITAKTKAIIVVHFAGRPCDMDAIMPIAKKHNLKVIEDCAHTIEAEYHGQPTGTIGDLGCFSFYATKNITTGEGGMVITDNPDYAQQVKVMALHGLSKDAWKRYGDEGFKHYQVVAPGYKYNMLDLQAALGIHQLPRIDSYWQRRQQIWQQYDQAFSDLPVTAPLLPEPDTKHAYHLYTLLINASKAGVTRDQFLDQMTELNIGVGVHYIAVHLHPYYQQVYGCKRGDFPNAELISDQTVSIPLSPKLTDQDVQDVIQAVTDVLS